MSTKHPIPEAESAADMGAQITEQAAPKKTRSRKGHERRVNAAIYVLLTLISIIWLIPFVFLVFQSFRSYITESGGQVAYLLPKQWSLDNYKYLFEGSDFFPWCQKAMLAACAAALIQVALLSVLKKTAVQVSNAARRWLLLGGMLLAGSAALVLLAAQVHGLNLLENIPGALLVLALYVAAGFFLGKGCLSQDDRLLRTIPGYEDEGKGSAFRRLAGQFGAFFTLSLLLQCLLKPIKTSQFLNWYGNTLIIALFVSVLQTAIVLSVSYALSRLRFKGRKLIMNTVLVLGLFPGFLTMLTLYFLLSKMNLTGEGAVPGLILIYVASSGMGYYISKGFFDTIPKSLDESARIDGATRFQVFLKIIMPLAKPIVIYTVLMAFMAPWGDYIFASYVVGTKYDYGNVAVGLYRWVNETSLKTEGFFTRFCAGGVLVALPVTLLFMALQKYYVEGVTGGAVKG